MEVEINKQVIVTLHLTEKEAMWLRDIMQNPYSAVTDEELTETHEDVKMRKKFFDALIKEL